MNKRQAKKKFKKQHGYNPPKNQINSDLTELLQALPKRFEDGADVFRIAIQFIIETLKEIPRQLEESVQWIKTMPDDEFDKMCANLPLDSIALARRIRGNENIT